VPPKEQTMDSQAVTAAGETRGKFFTFFVDDREFRVESESLTAGEVMDMAGIPRDVGLLLINEDGTQTQLQPDDRIEFEGPGRRFRKAPRFKRG
jgi:hypothetical protein